MKITNRIVVGAIVGLICLPLVAALAGAASVDATWRTSEDGFVNFAGYGYGGHRTDALIKASGGSFVGNGIYNATAVGQSASTTVGAGGTSTFTVRIQNDGSLGDRVAVLGLNSSSSFKVTYFSGTTDVTSQVMAGTYRTARLASGARADLQVVIKAKRSAVVGARVTVDVMVASVASPTSANDAVKAKVRRV